MNDTTIHFINREDGVEVLINIVGGKTIDRLFKDVDTAKDYVIKFLAGD